MCITLRSGPPFLKYAVSERNIDMRILIVDDEESITDILQLLLQDEGYKVDIASSGKEALTLAESHYDLAVIDVDLRDMNGSQVAREIMNRHTDVKIVFMTGYPELVASIRALDIDIVDILVKPFSTDMLKRLIREALSPE